MGLKSQTNRYISLADIAYGVVNRERIDLEIMIKIKPIL